MKFKKEISLPSQVFKLHETFKKANLEFYLVGGAVRDALLEKSVGDFDFATNAKPNEVCKLFQNVILTGIKHGTVSVLLEKQTYEITTYRVDGKYENFRSPNEVTFTTSLNVEF